MKPISVVIVDDEPLGRERIRSLLAEESAVTITAECSDGEDAVRVVGDAPPDIVFLDVQMPGFDGFDVIETLVRLLTPHELPVFVFVTAHAEHALRAFEVSASDYLLKPFDRARFREALERATTRVSERRSFHEATANAYGVLLRQIRELRVMQEATRAANARSAARFVVRTNGKISFILAGSIDWIEGDGNYARMHTAGRSHLVRETLTSVERRLDPHRFLRVHRSTIVNVDRITTMEPHGHGEYVVTMKDGTKLTSSRTYAAKLRELLT